MIERLEMFINRLALFEPIRASGAKALLLKKQGGEIPSAQGLACHGLGKIGHAAFFPSKISST